MQAILARAGLGPEQLLTVAAEEMVRLYREDRELYAGVVEILPLMEETQELRQGLAKATALGAAYLGAHPDMLAGRDPELLSLVIFHGLRGALNAVVANAPEKLDDESLPRMLAGGARGFLLGVE